MLKRFFCLLLCLLCLRGLVSCEYTTTFSNIEIGETFGTNKDGYFKKVSKNYCLFVLNSEATKLLYINETDIDKDFFNESVYNDGKEILKGQYISGFFNDDFLILCEAIAKQSYRYVSFNFKTTETTYYDNCFDVYSKFNFKNEDMFEIKAF